jgi:hypothetical protein
VAFIDKNNLAAAGFYYTDHSDVVCCAFCVAQIDLFQEGDDTFKDHLRLIPNCEFIRSLSVGNIPIGSSDQPTASLSSLPEAVTCVVLILSIEPIHIQNVSILYSNSSFSKCTAFIAPSLIFNVPFNYESQDL